MSRMPLRHRLVLGFAVAMGAVLVAAGAFVYWRVAYALDRSLDRDLDDATAALAPLVTRDGRVRDPTAVAAAGVAYQVLDADGRVMAGSVGDRLVTDVGLGRAGGFATALVLTGVTAAADVPDDDGPDHVLAGLHELPGVVLGDATEELERSAS